MTEERHWSMAWREICQLFSHSRSTGRFTGDLCFSMAFLHEVLVDCRNLDKNILGPVWHTLTTEP